MTAWLHVCVSILFWSRPLSAVQPHVRLPKTGSNKSGTWVLFHLFPIPASSNPSFSPIHSQRGWGRGKGEIRQLSVRRHECDMTATRMLNIVCSISKGAASPSTSPSPHPTPAPWLPALRPLHPTLLQQGAAGRLPVNLSCDAVKPNRQEGRR